MEGNVAVTIKGGSYEGQKGFMSEASKVYNGKALVMFPGNNIRGAYVKVEFISIDAVNTESKEDVKSSISNYRFVMFFIESKGSRSRYAFREWVNSMIVKFAGVNAFGLPEKITDHDLFNQYLLNEISQ